MEENEEKIESNITNPTAEKLFSRFDSISFIFGSIIGVGIFITISPTFDVFKSNSIIMVITFWVIGSLLCLLGALCYAELGCRFPQSGGESVYYKQCSYEKLSACFILMLGFFIKPLTLTGSSITASKYFIKCIINSPKYIEYIQIIFAIFILFAFFILNCFSPNIFAKINILFSVLKSLLLLIIIIIGFLFMIKGEKKDWVLPLSKDFSLIKFGICMVNILWAFEGWNSLGFIAGKVYKPNINLPLSIFIGVFSVAIMYILTIIGYHSVIGFDDIRKDDAIAIAFSNKTLSKCYWIIPILITFSALGSINSTFYMTSIAVATASSNGQLPKIFSLIHKKSKAPVISLFLIFLCAMLFMCFDLKRLLTYRAFITWVFYFCSFGCLLNAKIQNISSEGQYDGFRIPYLFIIIILVACLFVLFMCLYIDVYGCLFILAIVVVIYVAQYITEQKFLKNRLIDFDNNIVEWIKKYFNFEKLVYDKPKGNK